MKSNTSATQVRNPRSPKVTRLALPLIGALLLLSIPHFISPRVLSAAIVTPSLNDTGYLSPQDTPAYSTITATLSITAPVSPTATPSPTGISVTVTLTATPTPTATLALSSTNPTLTTTPTPQIDQTIMQSETGSYIYFPLIYHHKIPIAPVKALFCTSFGNPLAIPDNFSS